ncbi:MAG: hypothetical protein CMH64_04540 [Nanoarchaeota archaeon]|nr:hypothetical protein [Nanoarchaeota archaeon]|tara:strand:+ start:3017 stop:4846 length:1830 start_codon:yes stop_codon:yes gene_type:complete
MNVLFPHENIRKTQEEFINDIKTALKEKKHLLAHAPTGIGKTSATLSVVIPYALENGLSIFFLTSRHTQHKIAIETLKKIKELHNPQLKVVDLIGKQHMCLQEVETLTSQQFTDYCREMVDKKTCQYYTKLRNNTKLSFETSKLLKDTKTEILDVQDIITTSKLCELCPYEISILKAREANVLIMDYYHVFSPSISAAFLKKTEKTLDNSIIIVDEAHNLPIRMRDSLSSKLTLTTIERAIKEAQYYEQTIIYLEEIRDSLLNLSENLEEERLVKKQEFNFDNYEDIVENLEKVGEDIREQKQYSYISTVATFLQLWEGQDEGFARVISKNKKDDRTFISLSYRCLDPSLLSTDVIDTAHNVICMSGTLTPLEMYSDILGFKQPLMKSYENPFPKKNRLALIIPKTSTKFTKRSMGMYQDIARECAGIVNTIPGNTIVFFPSYVLRDSIDVFFKNLCKKTTYYEQKGISKQEKDILLENFKKDKNQGAVLMAVSGGNFSEGIDLPGDLLKAVVVVGLPLSRPDLETTELINYYDNKYSKGWDYGYTIPAMQKTIQAAGRCIRSETDKGVIIFLDERYSWENYYKCFPPDFNIHTTMLPLKRIGEFFKEN